MPNQYNALPMPDRFWTKVTLSEFCWTISDTFADGYGRFWFDGKSKKASHIAWMLVTGSLPPDDQMVGHTCDQRDCVRNDSHGTYTIRGISYLRYGHLFLCPSNAVNLADMVEKGRSLTGLRNGMYTHPESRCYGDKSGSRKYPERVSAGVKKFLREHPEFRQGERNPAAKLTKQVVMELRARYSAGGISKSALAREFGLPIPTVSDVLRRATWQHI